MSVNLYFVRHGEAESSWDKASDPGLSGLGHQQAEEVSKTLMGMTDPVTLFSSPLSRARETAAPLEKEWDLVAEIVPQVAEIPSHHIAFENRRAWLMDMMQSSWAAQPDILQNWRADILKIILAQKQDAIFFTHFMVINTIVSAIGQTDDIVVFRPDNCSVTRISLEKDQLKLIERGGEAITIVQ